MAAIMELLPKTDLGILFVLFSTARFENQRWVRARLRGLQGDNQAIGAFIDITGGLSLFFAFAFLVAYAVDTTILKAVVLFVLTGTIGIIYALVSTWVFKGESWIIWMVGTIAVWPLSLALVPQVTWFGLF
ncbi:MAG: hypothetical protein COA65_10510 [Rhodospirillaceae bacterium]|nr:MAG: hypothetical protein COA65_10510 [Rhodospirillaceae bacterium]